MTHDYGDNDYTREAQLRVRNSLRQTSSSELPAPAVATGIMIQAPTVIKDVHNNTLTTWVQEMQNEFTWTPVKKKDLPEDIETPDLKEPRAKHGRRHRKK